MSGIIGIFQMRTEFTALPDQPNGYCHIDKIHGGSLVDVNEQNPNGQWEVFLSYYAGLADFQGNPSSKMHVGNLFYLDGVTRIIQQWKLPYVPHTDPVDAMKRVLESWWPEGEIVE